MQVHNKTPLTTTGMWALFVAHPIKLHLIIINNRNCNIRINLIFVKPHIHVLWLLFCRLNIHAHKTAVSLLHVQCTCICLTAATTKLTEGMGFMTVYLQSLAYLSYTAPLILKLKLYNSRYSVDGLV